MCGACFGSSDEPCAYDCFGGKRGRSRGLQINRRTEFSVLSVDYNMY